MTGTDSVEIRLGFCQCQVVFVDRHSQSGGPSQHTLWKRNFLILPMSVGLGRPKRCLKGMIFCFHHFCLGIQKQVKRASSKRSSELQRPDLGRKGFWSDVCFNIFNYTDYTCQKPFTDRYIQSSVADFPRLWLFLHILFFCNLQMYIGFARCDVEEQLRHFSTHGLRTLLCGYRVLLVLEGKPYPVSSIFWCFFFGMGCRGIWWPQLALQIVSFFSLSLAVFNEGGSNVNDRLVQNVLDFCL